MRILMMTSVYRDYSLGKRDISTNVINSFVTDWIKQGHEVLVIHNAHCYPRIVYCIPGKIRDYLASKMGFAIEDYDVIADKHYNDNGANVYRMRIKKYIPHHTPSRNSIKKQIKHICTILEKENFFPDVITGHWASPQLEIISELKKIYKCRTAVVLHGNGYINSKTFNSKRYLIGIDRLGTRSMTQSVLAQKQLNLDKVPFVCYSGVPDEYLKLYKLDVDKFEKVTKWKFIYVGRLLEYKNIDATIIALSNLSSNIEWEFTIVGEGAARKKLEKIAKENNCESRVHFVGKVSRDKVMNYLKDSHVFVMISTNEVFGLSYLEAMAASCITIGSHKGGIDGVIVNEKNGFLCDEGNSMDLTKIINLIVKLDINDIKKIATNGYDTAVDFSDSKVAKRYLDDITKRF